MSAIASMQAVRDGSIAQLLAIQTQKNAVLASLALLAGGADSASVNVGTAGGSLAANRVTLNEQLKTLTDAEASLTSSIASQNQILSAMNPFTILQRRKVGGGPW